MKKTIFIILSVLFVAFSPKAQGQKTLYVGYVCQDESVSVDRMIKNIQDFVRQHKNDDFVILYNDNTKTLVMDNKTINESKLFGMIRSRNSTIYINASKELETLSTEYEKNIPKHTQTSINFFVGREFFANDYHTSLVARFLIINGILNNDRNTLTYYQCGDGITQDNIAFDNKYDISITPILK